MSEDPNKKPVTASPESAPVARVEQSLDINETEARSNADRLAAATLERQMTVQSQSETIKTSLENRVDKLPEEIKGEAAEILADAQATIIENNAELDAAAKELEDLFFTEGEKMGGDGPLPSEAEQNKAAKELAELYNVPLDESGETSPEQTETEKRQEVSTFVEGLKAMLADPDLPEEERAEIQEQITGFQESLGEAEATGRTIYEPAREESVTKVLPPEGEPRSGGPLKKEVPAEARELKEKIDELAKEIDNRGVRQVVYYGQDGYEFKMSGAASLKSSQEKDIIDGLFQNKQVRSDIAQNEYPQAKPTEALSYLLAGIDLKNHKFGDYVVSANKNDKKQAAYFLSILRTVEEAGKRTNAVRVNAVIPQELAGKLEYLLEENPKVVQAILLKLLPSNLPKEQLEELKKSPKYISRFRPGQKIPETPPAMEEPPKTKRRAAAPISSIPQLLPLSATAPSVEQSDRPAAPPAPEVRPIAPARPEAQKSREQLLVERQLLQREWEKEATKVAEHKMSKEEQKKYEELVSGRVAKNEKEEKKGRLTAAERQRMISDVGFTDADYQLMKTGAKPWTLNAIWKRLGELNQEISAAPPILNVPEIRVPSFEPRETPAAAAPERVDRPEVASRVEREKIVADILNKLDDQYQERNIYISQLIKSGEPAVQEINKQGKIIITDWKQSMDMREVAEAIENQYASKELIAKLKDEDLARIKEHFIKNLENSIALTEQNLPAEKLPSAPAAPESVERQTARDEILRQLQFDDFWYKDGPDTTLKEWQAAGNVTAIRKILQDKSLAGAEDIFFLKNSDLKMIKNRAIEYLKTIMAAEIGGRELNVQKQMAETQKKQSKKEIAELMKKRAELRKKVYVGEKGAAAKLRKVGSRLEKLRKEQS